MNDSLSIFLNTAIPQYFPKDEGWNYEYDHSKSIVWFYLRNNSKNIPDEGYKLHLSAIPHSCLRLFQRILYIFKKEKVNFKICASIEDLRKILRGEGGDTQVGKFITIYPYDNQQAVRIASIINQMTSDIPRPLIPFEPALGEKSCVFYRYGSFKTHKLQLDNGQIVNSIRSPSGEMVEDNRSNTDFVSWKNDPFVDFKKYFFRENKKPLKNKYILINTFYFSIKGSVFLAMDINNVEEPLVLIKEALCGVWIDPLGHDSRSKLLHEKTITHQLQNYEWCPKPIDYWEEHDSSYLVYKFIVGVNYDNFLKQTFLRGSRFQEMEIVSMALKILAIVEDLHSNNIVYRDLKPSNLLLNEKGNFFLIDYENAIDPNKHLFTNQVGSYGYSLSRSTKNIFDRDIYSFGALLFYLITSYDPSYSPPNWDLARHITKFNINVDKDLIGITQKCLESKFENVKEIIKELKIFQTKQLRQSVHFKNERIDYLSLSNEIGKSICAEVIIENDLCYWKSLHSSNFMIASRNLYNGVSGIGIFLLDLFAFTGKDEYLNYIKKSAKWLEVHDYTYGRKYPHAGLFTGESGVGLFFLKLYNVTTERYYLEKAVETSDLISQIPFLSSDIINGAAGIGLFHLFLSNKIGKKNCIRRAKEAGLYIIDQLCKLDDIHSTVNGNISLNNKLYLGFSHGLAGMGYFLYELYNYTNMKIFLDYANNVSNTLNQLSKESFPGSNYLIWSDKMNDHSFHIHWCHGATGIGQFYLKAFETTHVKEYLQIAYKIANTIFYGGRGVGTTKCHGLAGNIDFLIDLYNIDKNEDILIKAKQLGSLLESFKICESTVKWISDFPGTFTPDFMVGYAGIGDTMLRLHDLNLPNFLSTKRYI